MCIRRETREKARQSLAFSRVSKPHTHITHMLRQCTSIVYLHFASMDFAFVNIVSCKNIKLISIVYTSRYDNNLSYIFPLWILFLSISSLLKTSNSSLSKTLCRLVRTVSSGTTLQIKI